MKSNFYYQKGYGGIEWILFAGFLGLVAYIFFFPMITKESPKLPMEQCYIDPEYSTTKFEFNGKTYVLLKQAAAMIRQQVGYHFLEIGKTTINQKQFPVFEVILDGDFNNPPLPTGFVIYTRPGRSEGGTYRPSSGAENLRFVDVSENYPLIDKAYVVIDIYLLEGEPVPEFILDYCRNQQPASSLLLIQDTDGKTIPNLTIDAGTGWSGASPRNVEYRMFAYDKRGSNSFNLTTTWGSNGKKEYTFTSDGKTATYIAHFLDNSSTETITLVNKDPNAEDADIGYKYTPAEFGPQPVPTIVDLHKKSPLAVHTQHLEAFVPFGIPPWGWWTPECKPAVYLYPEKETIINVKVNITNGSLTYTDPVYAPDLGWSVLAKPNGELYYFGKNLGDSKGIINYPLGKLPYLYYEGKIKDESITKPTQGFVKTYDELATFFDEVLPKLGLNEKESLEFKQYWLKALPKSNYYFIGIIPQEELNTNEPLTITPKEDTMIRVRLYFEALDEFKSIITPLIETPKRNGFTVVDWGGMVKQDKNHPFTCLQ